MRAGDQNLDVRSEEREAGRKDSPQKSDSLAEVQPESVLLFRVGEVRCCVDVTDLFALIGLPEITPVPLAPRQVVGLFNHRAQVVPAVSLYPYLGVRRGRTPDDGYVIMSEIDGELVGFCGDDILDIIQPTEEDWSPVPIQTSIPFCKYVLLRDEGLYLLIRFDLLPGLLQGKSVGEAHAEISRQFGVEVTQEPWENGAAEGPFAEAEQSAALSAESGERSDGNSAEALNDTAAQLLEQVLPLSTTESEAEQRGETPSASASYVGSSKKEEASTSGFTASASVSTGPDIDPCKSAGTQAKSGASPPRPISTPPKSDASETERPDGTTGSGSLGIKKDRLASYKSATQEKKPIFASQTQATRPTLQRQLQRSRPAAKPFQPVQVPSRPGRFTAAAGGINVTTPAWTQGERGSQLESGPRKSRDRSIAWGTGLLGLLLFAFLAFFINSGEGPVDSAANVEKDLSTKEHGEGFGSSSSDSAYSRPETGSTPAEPELPYQPEEAPSQLSTSALTQAELAALEVPTVTPEPPLRETIPVPVEPEFPLEPEKDPPRPAAAPPRREKQIVEIFVPAPVGRKSEVIVHHILWGDTLSKISRRYLGDMMLFPRLAKQNKIPNADLIYAGNILKIRIGEQDELIREE